MVIRHSKLLLEQLSELENKIKLLESAMNELGIEMDREKLLRLMIGQKVRDPLAKKSMLN
jgi:hypothetical protein